MLVQPGLCRTCSETTLLVFPRGGSFRDFDFRCPKYTNVPVTCTFVADPKDPTCCRVPSCQGTGTGTGTGTGSTGSGPGGVGVPQSFSGSFTGYGRPPNFSPSTLAQTGYSSKQSFFSTAYKNNNYLTYIA